MKRVPSPPVSPGIAAMIKRLLERGLYQHQIASILGINQGRVSEVKTGKKHAKVPPSDQLFLDFG